MTYLTDTDREALIVSITEPDDDCVHNMVPLYATVETLLARVAAETRESVLDEAEAVLVKDMPDQHAFTTYAHSLPRVRGLRGGGERG